MNPFLISFVALCITQGAIAQYQSNNGAAGGSYQRKMSPSPQSYGSNSNSYQQRESYEPMSNAYEHAPMAAYQQQQQQQPQQYQPQQQQQSYRAPSSASVSTYDERTPAASSGYGKAAAAPASYGQSRPAASSYGQQQQAAGSYGQQQSYAKAAPKYEEPSHPPMPFAWGYDINDGYGGAQYHKESGDEYGKRTGSYGYTDAYGVYRQVDYVADEHGFRATVKTNEPGTANESPADVELHAYEPPSNYYAGNSNNNYGSSAKSSSGSYGQQQQQQQQSYSRPAASASSSYGAQAQTTTYAPVVQQRSSYKSAAAAAAAAPAPASSYSRQQSNSYEQAEQYARGSAMVPVYKAAPVAAPVAAKRY